MLMIFYVVMRIVMDSRDGSNAIFYGTISEYYNLHEENDANGGVNVSSNMDIAVCMTQR